MLVIGAGQAGFAIGRHLKARDLPFRIIEAHGRVGDRWRECYPSLTSFTPRRFSGLDLPGDPEGYAGRNEFADYLDRHAKPFSLPISTEARVEKLTRRHDCIFESFLSTRESVRNGVTKTIAAARLLPAGDAKGLCNASFGSSV